MVNFILLAIHRCEASSRGTITLRRNFIGNYMRLRLYKLNRAQDVSVKYVGETVKLKLMLLSVATFHVMRCIFVLAFFSTISVEVVSKLVN